MKNSLVSQFLVLAIFFSISSNVLAQRIENKWDNLDIREVVNAYAEATGEPVIIDPRVKGRVNLLNETLQKLSFDDLSSILQVHNFSIVRTGNYFVVAPTNITKQMPIPLVKSGEKYAPGEIVTDVIKLEKVCPSNLTPLIRPLLAPTSHFSSLDEPRVFLITDTYENTKRIREVVLKIESHIEKKQVCRISKSE